MYKITIKQLELCHERCVVCGIFSFAGWTKILPHIQFGIRCIPELLNEYDNTVSFLCVVLCFEQFFDFNDTSECSLLKSKQTESLSISLGHFLDLSDSA